MNDKPKIRDLSTDPLPSPLAQALMQSPPGLRKRERTRRQILVAALGVFSARGVAGCTIQEIADAAGVTTGTVYNHFDDREAVVVAVALWLADTLSRRIAETQAMVEEGAQRMAIGQRRYMWLAQQSPAWALMLIDIAGAAPHLLGAVGDYIRADLALAIRQKAFRIGDEAAAVDLCIGACSRGMLTIALGQAKRGYDVQMTAMLLRALGMEHAKAAEVAARPLPPFPPLAESQT